MDRFIKDRPSSTLRTLQTRANHFFETLFQKRRGNGTNSKTAKGILQTDVLETGSGYRVRVELPGVDSDTLQVHVEDRRITIRGKWGETVQRNGQRRLPAKHSDSSFYRSIALPKQIYPGTVEAVFKNGILIADLSKVQRSDVESLPRD